MPADKIRLRSDEELECQRVGLVELADLLDARSVAYWLASGTLLGAVREKNFIRWDWDVQLYFRAEDVFDRTDELKQLFLANGFDVRHFHGTYEDLKLGLAKRGGNFELTGWYEQDGMRYRKRSQLPARFFKGGDVIDFLGRRYPCMSPPADYLEWCYGDWRTPRRTADKATYLNHRFFRDSASKRRIAALAANSERAAVAVLGPAYRAVRRLFRPR
jgi:hypothetical protein